MNLITMEDLFFFMTIVGFITYFVSIGLVFIFKNKIVSLNSDFFELDKKTINEHIYKYFILFKVLLIVFTLIPWLSLLIMINK